MFILVKLFLVIYLSGLSFSDDTAFKSTREYIDFKFSETKDILTQIYSERVKEDEIASVKIDWERLWSETPRRKRPRAVGLSDQMFIIEGKQVLSIDSKSHIHSVNELDLASVQGNIKFVKQFSWKGSIFLLVCQENICTNYQGTDVSHLVKRQIIQYEDLLPIDACFFARGDQVYLIISYFSLNNVATSTATPSKIYQWTGKSLNFTTEVFTPAVKTVSTFNDDESTIILFALEHNLIDGVDIKISCVVYELKNNSEIDFFTYLPEIGPVTSIHLYNYDGEEFVLLTSDDTFRGIFLWDGTDLQRWIRIPSLKASSLVKVAQVKNETLLFVCNNEVLHVYKIADRACVHLNDLILSDGQRVVEINVWEYENSIMLVLIKLDSDGTYPIELWQLTFRDEEKAKLINEPIASDEVSKCLKELKTLLDNRTPLMESLKESWSKLLRDPTKPLRISELILDGGNISIVELDNSNESNVSNPVDIHNNLMNLEKSIDGMLNSSRNIFLSNVTTFSGKVVVEEDVVVENLIIDSLDVEYLNNRKFNTNDFFISGLEQSFSSPLEAEVIYIDNLEVPSLCGLSSDHWLQVNDTLRTRLDNIIDRSMIYNDTIFIDRDLTLSELNAETINGVNVTDFLEHIFVVGKNQIIRGNVTYQKLVQALRVTTGSVNNVSSSLLLTRYTNQSLGDVYIDSLSVNDLFVEKINGVPVDRAARMSQENVIKGKVTIGDFVITDQLMVNENVSFPMNQTTQVYDEILINGDVYVDNLKIEDEATLAIGKDVFNSYNIYDIVENSWSKSSDQIIQNDISLLKGASIDELSCQYLNGLGEHDFLYVNQESLADLENVTFMRFYFDSVANESTGIVDNFYDESSEIFTFRRSVRFSRLKVDYIIADSYNGIPISKLMEANDTLAFTGITEFDVVRVIGTMTVDDLRVNRINEKLSFPIHEALMSGQNLYAEALETNDVNMRNLKIQNLNGHDLEEALQALTDLTDQTDNISITIDGVLEIEGKLAAERINNQKSIDFIDALKDDNLIDLIETNDIRNLRIIGALNVTSLNGVKIEELFETALSKSSKQIIIGECEASDATVAYLYTKKINNKNISELMYTDEPYIFYGDVSFSELLVKGDMITKTVNGKLVSEIEEEQRMIPLTDGINLHVFGEVTWDEPSSSMYSVGYLLSNAVTKHDDQIINSTVIFEKSVVIESLYLKDDDSYDMRKIKDIVNDAVVNNPNGEPVVVNATKIFKKKLVVSDLEVTSNIDVNSVNGLNFKEVASEIFQKYSNDSVSGQVTFLGAVQIGTLITSKSIHGVPLYQLVTKNKNMPDNMRFEHLIVQGNVSLLKIDDVDFDAFTKKRIDIREDREIYGDVQFDDTVVVKSETFVHTVNGIRPTDLVQNDPTGVPIVIYGNKVFAEDVLVLQDVETSLINNLNISEMFEKSILQDENVTIEGSLIFENDVEVLGNINVSGHINNVNPDKLVESHLSQIQSAINLFNKEKSLIEYSVLKSQNLSSSAKMLLYLERDETLNIELPGVYNVKSTQINSSTRLDVYATESADFCGLAYDCFCRKQYVIEISSSGKHKINERTSPKIAFNFYESNGVFGLRVITEAVSSSRKCSQPFDEPERTQVFWMTFDDNIEKQSRETVLEVNGFVADAQAFLVNDRLYLILAIFYDKATNSHATDSLIYELDYPTKKATALQHIATDGAKALQVFRIVDVGVYMLIGCVKGKAESLLFRFNPENRQFQLVRSFSTGGSRHIGSVSGKDDKSFVILNNHDIEALQIFAYQRAFDNFYEYQNLYFESRVTSLNVFYAGEFGNSDALLAATTKDGSFYIYEYMHVGKFQLKISHSQEDIQVLSPFHYSNRIYLFAGLKYNSTMYRFIEQGLD